MRKALLVATASLGLIGGLALPAAAAQTGDTTTTFELTAGTSGLSISAPASKSFVSVALGGDPSEALGVVTVDDQRGALLGSWTATASATDFVTGDTDPLSANLTERTIGNELVDYAPGLLSSGASVGTFLPGLGGNMGASQTAATAAATVGVTNVTWDPTITVNVPAAAVAGVYSGTVTHSVA